MSRTPLAPFLHPEGFAQPALRAVLAEGRLTAEMARLAARSVQDRRTRSATPYAGRPPERSTEPVVLVPGFLAGDVSLRLMSAMLRRNGYRSYRSHIHANVGCTLNAAAQLEQRLEWVAQRRGSRVRIVGHSLGGMLARGLAVRRPDLVSGIVTLGSPMLAPAAHHALLSRSVDVLVRLSRAGVPGLMAEDCVAGECARMSWEESREPVPAGVGFTAVYSRRDGIVDWRACVDPLAEAVEVTASHVGMAVDPRVMDEVLAALRRQAAGQADSLLEVDGGVGA
ncbi:triacylglycerol lipase [Nocardioides sp.]|uniref:esterase/lipase family protein n=1 Tax=Nocardioides sp. TaxID=35761 RepID=UPI002732E871|nr:alpha/beta fold hydrolase [Nocardioides sp.]MDP3892463.1 alpha/beta fold hydrolase [Nocardioides sp.]